MKHPMRATLLLLTLGLYTATLTWQPAAAPPVLLNTSASAPEGLYLRVDRPLTVGELVAACLPEALGRFARERGYLAAGRCPGGTAPVLKRVAALGGDEVDLDRFPLRTLDRAGRPLPVLVAYPLRVPAGQVLLLGDGPLSFDSRYFGPLEESAVLGVYRPGWLWRAVP
jgi:conjugative transfer signal peptidase TraF